MKARWLALSLLIAASAAATASAQISIPLPGTGGSIQINPQPDNRYPPNQYPNQNPYYGGAVSIRVLGAVYGRNCRGSNVTDDLARQCQGRDYCVYHIDYRQIGDPSPGCAKDYHARYMCRNGDGERYASANPEASGQSVVLDCRR